MTDIVTCYHEAGHAVAAYLLGGDVDSLSLGGEADEFLPRRMGECRIAWPNDGSAALRNLSISDHRFRELLTLLAGGVAEQIYEDDPSSLLGAVDDLRRAERLAIEIVSSRMGGAMDVSAAVQSLLRAAAGQLHDVLSRPRVWPAVAAIADELDAHEELQRDQIDPILEFWLR